MPTFTERELALLWCALNIETSRLVDTIDVMEVIEARIGEKIIDEVWQEHCVYGENIVEALNAINKNVEDI